ncbi:Na(+) H(+) exchange regulatory cofactor NHE, partial [Brachionus plicatilis]
MFLADEILKLLVCEICFENFDEKDHLPIALFPCGHTFCANCVQNLNNQTCPACNQKFEKRAKNWAIINLIPRAKIPEVYEKLKEVIENSFGLIEKIETMDSQTKRDYRNNLDWIRESINIRAEDLIKRIRELQNGLIDRLDEFENKWESVSEELRNKDSKRKSSLTKIKADIAIEEVKTSQEKLDEYKSNVDSAFDELNERLDSLNKLKNDLVSFKNSNVDLDELNSDRLFGKLEIENLDFGFIGDKSDDDDTYAEIQNTLNEFDRLTEAPIVQSEKIQQTHTKEASMVQSEKSQHPKTKEAPNTVSALQIINPIIVPPQYPFPTEPRAIKDESESEGHSLRRKCQLVRAHKTDFYGFELKSMKNEGKHYTISIQADSPASRAGLRENDLIIEVNEESVIGLEREQVVKKMLKHSKHVDLTVFDESEARKGNIKSLTLDNKKLRASSIDSDDKYPESRMIILSRSPGSKSFGFSINKGKTGAHFISQIEKNSPAANSSMRIGDCILKVNGINLVHKSFSKAIDILKKESEKSDKFQVEVIQPEYFNKSSKKISRASSADNLDVDEYS